MPRPLSHPFGRPAPTLQTESESSEPEPEFFFTAVASSVAATETEVLLYALLILVVVTRPDNTYTLAAWLKEVESEAKHGSRAS